MKLPQKTEIQQQVQLALAEDVGSGDVTAALIPQQQQAVARVICRENAVICGQAWFDEVFAQLDSSIQIHWQISEGERIAADSLVCELRGPAQRILTGERSALNFLQTLSATATITAEYVQKLATSHTKLLDTRKTLPGLRNAQKYAVACGGGQNHRMGLFDAILLKENHIMAAGSIAQAIQTARDLYPNLSIEVETETLAEVQQALSSRADIIMLDNFSLEMMRDAVALVNGAAKLEVSGDVTLDTLAKIAQTGVDYVSSGALTKHIKAVDLSMRFEMQP